MTDKEKIKEEIERLKNKQLSIFSKGESVEICGTALTCIGIYNQLLSFIDSLPEEHNKDLDFQTFAREMCAVFALPSSETQNTEENPSNWEYAIARHFAEWQKQQMNEALQTEYEKGRFDMREEMMKDAIYCNVDWYDGFMLDYTQEQQDDVLLKLGADVGDKVKIIILKTEQQ